MGVSFRHLEILTCILGNNPLPLYWNILLSKLPGASTAQVSDHCSLQEAEH